MTDAAPPAAGGLSAFYPSKATGGWNCRSYCSRNGTGSLPEIPSFLRSRRYRYSGHLLHPSTVFRMHWAVTMTGIEPYTRSSRSRLSRASNSRLLSSTGRVNASKAPAPSPAQILRPVINRINTIIHHKRDGNLPLAHQFQLFPCPDDKTVKSRRFQPGTMCFKIFLCPIAENMRHYQKTLACLPHGSAIPIRSTVRRQIQRYPDRWRRLPVRITPLLTVPGVRPKHEGGYRAVLFPFLFSNSVFWLCTGKPAVSSTS